MKMYGNKSNLRQHGRTATGSENSFKIPYRVLNNGRRPAKKRATSSIEPPTFPGNMGWRDSIAKLPTFKSQPSTPKLNENPDPITLFAEATEQNGVQGMTSTTVSHAEPGEIRAQIRTDINLEVSFESSFC